MNILLTNDDGYMAAGLAALRQSLKGFGRIITVAPDRDRSGASHSLTVARPLRVKRIDRDFYCVDGTPTDSVMLAVYCLLKKPPDLIISGINDGANMGEDVTYSGTVAAAIEGTLLGIPSLAISLVGNGRRDYDVAVKFTKKIVRAVIHYGLPEGVLLNINVPHSKKASSDKFAFTRLGKRIYQDVITEKIDPRGQHYYWIAGKVKITGRGPDTDYGAIDKNFISITPLSIDMTAFDFIDKMMGWKI